MKYCPVCQTRYDEEIIKFCTKDGAPLVEENPTFTAMPSDNFHHEDDGEETVIRRNSPASDASNVPSSQRIVIPTNEVRAEPVRAKTQPAYQKPPQKSNTAIVVLLTILGTFVVLGALGGIWYLLRGNNAGNANANKTNININSLTNTNSSNLNSTPLTSNTNANFSVNTNVNTNVNANLKTPTPTPSRTPTPTPTPVNSNVNANQNTNIDLGNTNIMSRPTPTPNVSPTPRVAPTPAQNVNVGLMNSRAVSLTTPAYPQTARTANAAGQVTVQISVDEQGNVTSAKAVSGNPLLRSSAEAAARQSRFNPVKVGDRAVNASGYLVYNFINQ